MPSDGVKSEATLLLLPKCHDVPPIDHCSRFIVEKPAISLFNLRPIPRNIALVVEYTALISAPGGVMKSDARTRDNPLKIRWSGVAVGAAMSLGATGAYAGDAQSPYSLPLRATPANAYLYPGSYILHCLLA